jgi:tRNA (adenine57-N1/adenine58-N1)-methyltransferase catalytic subunit
MAPERVPAPPKPFGHCSTYSAFINPGPNTTHGSLSLIALSRQSTVPALLRKPTASDPTDEITNTRFGSFPHSTLLSVPYGSQVIASNVNARDSKRGKKRKRGDSETADTREECGEKVAKADAPAFEAAASGFAHVLYPTPEMWTYSLPHRTQVVYTPDYSYILQRIQARPGDAVIEAGAGSGSFTHAAARAVFNGFPGGEEQRPFEATPVKKNKTKRFGHVYSFEYHEPRCETLTQEIKAHGLDSIVTLTHRDVYNHGFLVPSPTTSSPPENLQSPQATAIFLDLPAPWLALPHLTRGRGHPSALNPSRSAHICTFSPCIEQATRTIEAMRQYGWLEIEMVTIEHRRIDVRRDRVGLHEEGLRGVNAVPGTVDEAVSRLRAIESKQNEYHEKQKAASKEGVPVSKKDKRKEVGNGDGSRKERLEGIKEALKERKLYLEGTLVHRTEQELKTHTSFLVFAILPREWSEEDEKKAIAKWAADPSAEKKIRISE